MFDDAIFDDVIFDTETVTRVRARFDIELSAADEDEVVALFFGIVIIPRSRG